MPDNMRIGSPVLRIKDIDKVLAFYETVGLQVNRKHQNNRGNILYELGFKYAVDYADKPRPRPFVILHYDPNARVNSDIQPDYFILQYLSQIERVLLQPIWHLEIQV